MKLINRAPLDGNILFGKFVKKQEECCQQVKVPDWIEYNFNIAKEVAKRSKDAQSQFGCVITSPDHHILSTGYNSFVRGLPDHLMPNLRPNKYPFMIHSEMNAIFNKKTDWFAYPSVIGYITGEPCITCLQALAQNNVRLIYYLDKQATMCKNEQEKEIFDFLVQTLPISIYKAVNE